MGGQHLRKNKNMVSSEKGPLLEGGHKSYNNKKIVAGENFPNMPDVTGTFQKV